MARQHSPRSPLSKACDCITELVVRLGASFSAEQEALLLRRLRGLREDFLALQAKPRFAGPGCK